MSRDRMSIVGKLLKSDSALLHSQIPRFTASSGSSNPKYIVDQVETIMTGLPQLMESCARRSWPTLRLAPANSRERRRNRPRTMSATANCQIPKQSPPSSQQHEAIDPLAECFPSRTLSSHAGRARGLKLRASRRQAYESNLPLNTRFSS